MAATEGGRQVANFGAGPAKLPRSVSRGTAGLGVLVPPAPRGAPTAKRGIGKLIDRNYRSLPAQRRNLLSSILQRTSLINSDFCKRARVWFFEYSLGFCFLGFFSAG